jgi:hypothetical protein
MPRTPRRDQLLLIADASQNLARAAISMMEAQAECAADSEYAHSDLIDARENVLKHDSRLRVALQPVRRSREFAVRGWPDRIYLALIDIWETYKEIATMCEASWPLYRKYVLLGSGNNVVGPYVSTANWNPMNRENRHESIIDASNQCLTSFTSEVANGIFAPFESVAHIEDLQRAGWTLSELIWADCYPNLLPRVKDHDAPPASASNFHFADARPDQSRLTREDIACGAWVAMRREGKTPTMAEIAQKVGCHREALYRLPGFVALVKRDKVAARARECLPHEGYRDRETGKLEAVEYPRDAEV